MKQTIKKSAVLLLVVVMLIGLGVVTNAQAATYKNGSKGRQVQYLQQNISFLGYSTGVADGIYGNNTKKAVARLQEALHLDVTGSVDDELDELIRGTVADIQRYLVKKGYLKGAIDGIKGNATGKAFKKFQKDLGYAQTGIVSLDILKAILNDSSVSVEQGSLREWVVCLENVKGSEAKDEKQYSKRYLDLFREYPLCLENEAVNRVFSTYISTADSVLELNQDDTVFGAILTGLSQGKDIIWNEVNSLFGGKEKSYKEQMRYDAISCLMRDVCGANNVIETVSAEVGNSFETLDKGYALASEAAKVILVSDLAEVCTSLSYETLGDIVDSALKEANTGGLECVEYGIDTVEYIIGLVQLYEIDNVTLEMLQRLLPSDCDMYSDLEFLKQEKDKDQCGYFVEHFMAKGVQELLCEAMATKGIGLPFPSNVVMSVTEIGIDIFAQHIYQGALSEELIQTLLMKSYVNTLRTELGEMQLRFAKDVFENNKVPTIEEIDDYEFLYTAYVAAVKNYMISAQKIADGGYESLLGQSVEEIDGLLNYDNYITLCLKNYPGMVVGISYEELEAIKVRYANHKYNVGQNYSHNTEAIVKDLQIMLNAEDGYNLLSVNGVFDSATHKAVCSFQARRGLAVDGIAGNATWAELYEVLSARIKNMEDGGLNINAMLDYAKLHWSNYNTDEYLSYKNVDTDCCNYVSQILCAGGLSETDAWHGSKNYKDITDTFDYIPDFIDYMRNTYNIAYCTKNASLIKNNPEEYDKTTFSINDIEVGDCITYNGDLGRNHIMFVIGVDKKNKIIYYTAHTKDRYYGISDGGWISLSIVDGLLKTSDIRSNK